MSRTAQILSGKKNKRKEERKKKSRYKIVVLCVYSCTDEFDGAGMHITKRKKPAKGCEPTGEIQGPSSSKDMGSKRFTVLIVSDPFRTKTSWK